METREKIELLVRSKFNLGDAPIGFDQDIFETCGIDSIEAVNLISHLEKEFNIEIPDYEIMEVKTFMDLEEVIKRRVI